MPKKQPHLALHGDSTFGDVLRYLRERAHLSQRELALLVGYHFSYISYLEKNTRSIDEASLLGRFVPALGLEDEPEWVARLVELSKNKNGETPTVRRLSEAATGEENADSLPTSLTAMIGREYESARLQKMILDPEIRLISIIGPPGVGKTCLAIAVAHKVFSAFEQGVIFVDLTTTDNPQMFLPTLANALSVQESSSVSIEDAIKSSLAKKNVLLVLDNFEQIVDASPKIIPLLTAGNAVKILVTSREALRLRGEYEFHLTPLPVPSEYEKMSTEQLRNFASIALFVERAQAVRPEFSLDEKNASQIAEICSRLDGLPLAVELAAARIGVLSLPAMLNQFPRRFDWLTQGARDLPEWRQTLLGAVEWSYNLLSEKERVLLCRLSIFSGGWTLEAAEEVCSDDDQCLRSEIFSLLIQLTDKSLVVPETEADRFHFLETLREFAREKLKADGDLERMRERHCAYFLKFAQTARPHLVQGKDQLLWLNRMEIEYKNLREVLEWAVEDASRVTIAMDFAMAVHGLWLTRSRINEARYWLAKIFALDSSPGKTRVSLLQFASSFACAQGDFSTAHLLEKEAMEISRILDDEEGIYSSMDGMAMIAGMQGDYKKAAELLEEALRYYRNVPYTPRLTATLNNLAISMRRLGDLDRAMQLITEAIGITKKVGNQKSLAHALNSLAELQNEMGNIETALQIHHEAILLRLQLGDRKGLAFSFDSAAECMEKLGNYRLAVQLWGASSRIRDELGLSIPPATLDEYNTLLARARTKLGNSEFESVWTEGRSMQQDRLLAIVFG